jgi:hypothetical protein
MQTPAAGPDMIVFNFHQPARRRLTFSALPVITDPLSSRLVPTGDSANTPGIQLDGSGAGDTNGMIVAGDSTMKDW